MAWFDSAVRVRYWVAVRGVCHIRRVWINSSTGAVTVADASGVDLQTTFTVRATAAPSGDTFDRVITTPVASLFALEIEPGFALEIESGYVLEVA